MSGPVAGRTPTGKVWHVAVWTWRWVTLCGRVLPTAPERRPLATVPAYQLCQKCERAAEQIAAAVREVQS